MTTEEITQARIKEAQACVRRGWTPIKVKGKKPYEKEWQKKTTTTMEEAIKIAQEGNFGILTGQASGIFVLDVDTKKADGGKDGMENIKAFRLPKTPTVRTGSGGVHYYFKDSHGLGCSVSRLAPGIDGRGSGGMVVAPSSTHPDTKELYSWKTHPDTCELAELPPDIVFALRKKSKGKALSGSGDERIHLRAKEYLKTIPGAIQGEGGDKATWKAALAIRRGFSLSDDEAFELLWAEYNPRCDPPWSEKEIRHKIEEAGKSTLEEGYLLSEKKDKVGEGGGKVCHETDAGNADRLVKQHGDNLKYCHKFNAWYAWDGKCWGKDESEGIVRRATETARSVYDEVNKEQDSSRNDALCKHGKASQKKSNIDAMIRLAKSHHSLLVSPEQLDTDPMLLNVSNGTLDLKTGKLREFRRSDLMTKVLKVEYDSEGQCPVWQNFLQTTFNRDDKLIEFVQKMLGYTLTGSIKEQCLFMLYGTGSNGKSTLIETVRRIMGDYGKQANFETFTVMDSGTARNDLARLAGARFVSASEGEAGHHLAESVVKQITGGDTITARFLYQENFEYIPQFKIFLATNHRPEIKGTDDAMWRRIKLIPFDVTIHDSEQDKDLMGKLEAEKAGILAWMARGCLKWQKEGLKTPKSVLSATKNYREEMDIFGQFLEDRCDIEKSARVRPEELYRVYETWCIDAGIFRPMARNKFGMTLEGRGYSGGKEKGVRWRYGLKCSYGKDD